MRLSDLSPADTFSRRHVGPSGADRAGILGALGAASLDALMEETVPPSIRLRRDLDLPAPLSESELLDRITRIAESNEIWRSFQVPDIQVQSEGTTFVTKVTGLF